MTGRRALIVLGIGASFLLLSSASLAATIDHEIRFPDERIRVDVVNGHARFVARGAVHEERAGRPDLPWFGERVDLPEGQRVTGVEVISLQTELVGEGVKVASAPIARPGAVAIERSAPDPAFFSTDRIQPENPVELGIQGYRRGHAEAWLRVAPVRWQASTGRLERITRMTVRLTLESGLPAERTPRERVIADWEDEPIAPTLRGGGVAAPTSLRALRGPAQPLKATQIPSVLGSPVAYLIITDEAQASEYQRLADWKTQCGLPAVVRTIEFIRSQYPGAADDAERVRKFIRDAYSRWGTKWVLLGGDTDILPTRYAYTTYFGGNFIATDMYFSCLDGTWNADGDSTYGEGYLSSSNTGDSCDFLPDVYAGRSSTSSAAAAKQFVDRVFQYSRTPVGDYEDKILFFAEVLFPQDWSPGEAISQDGAALVEEVLPTFDAHPEFRKTRLYENYTDTSYVAGALQLTKANVLDSLDAGFNIAVHVGHGYRNTMSVGNATLTNSDALGLTNGNRLTNFYAINCTSNAIDFPCIGEAFLQANGGGSVSNIGSTNFDFPSAGHAFQDEYFRLLVDDSVTSVGEAQALQKLPFAGFSVYDNVNRWTELTLLLLGDPQMPIWTNIPRLLTVTHPASIALSDTSVAVHVETGGNVLPNARVTLYKAGDDYSSGLTDASGDITLPFRPDSLGAFTLTVTGFNCRPYQADVTITGTGVPVVVDPSWTVDDDNSGGTSGNGDGIVDGGEVADLIIPLRNNGGAAAPSVSATLSSTDPWISILSPDVSYGAIAAGGEVVPSTGFRITTPYTVEDQREIPLELRVFDGAGGSRVEKLQLVIHGPELVHASHLVQDTGGTPNGIPEAGETVTYTLTIRNSGTGPAQGVTARLRDYDGLATVLDSTAIFGTIAPLGEVSGDAVQFVVNDVSAKLELQIADEYGPRSTQMIDLIAPVSPSALAATGQATSVQLQWHRSTDSDLRGYNIYRATSAVGPYSKVNSVPTDRTSYYLDEGLNPLSAFYFEVTAVDSSANESAPSLYASASTSPPTHTIFPVQMDGTTPSSVAIGHVYPGYPVALVAGAMKLYAWNPDGTAPVDADGDGTTYGDFSTEGNYFAAGPSISDLDGDGTAEIIAPTWNDSSVYVFDPAGQDRPGWPFRAHEAIWSSAAIGDLDNNGHEELAFGSNGNKLFVLRDDGTEWMDGDSNPSTQGVFKVLGSSVNYGTPALADIDGDTYLDIVYGGFDGNLYAWDRFGNNLPGFPVNLGSNITASAAIGLLDGPSDTVPDIVIPTTGNQLYVVEPGGTIRTGFPVFVPSGGTSRCPSPALADMNNDGYLDIVLAGTNGGIFVYDRNGSIVAPWNNVRFTPSTSSATESSPVVADITGDGLPDIVIGSEDSQLSAIANDGNMLPGFPIILGGEVRGTPALCDCDGDGKTEIVLAGWDELMHVWDYDFPFSPGKTPPWPQFHHDARRTGFASNTPFTDVPSGAADGLPARVELALPAPNPAHAMTRFDFAIPGSRSGETFDLSLFDVNGRRVRTLASGRATPGRHSVSWNLRDAEGGPARTGIYFARFRVGSEVRSQKFVVIH